MVILCLTASLTLSNTFGKYTQETKYSLELTVKPKPIHFHFTPGKEHSFTVRYDGYYAFQLWGGAGGSSKRRFAIAGTEEYYAFGGLGGMITAVGYFQKDEVLTITVGLCGNTNTGGFGGGGNGGTDTGNFFNYYYGGGGGGATDVRISSGIPGDRILVAGGGGGASGGNVGSLGYNYPPTFGGNGGSAENGFFGTSGSGQGFGYGGTQTEGGAGWQNGTPGVGGNAQYSGGGGGGGYYGGGGASGSGGGGGGGSSYIESSFTTNIPSELPERDSQFDTKDGYATISFFGKTVDFETFNQ